MYICRLFHRDRPFEQVEARLLGEGRLTLGRDPSADWAIADPDIVLSRIHCPLNVQDGRLFLCDSSTNGTFLENGARAPTGEPVEIFAGQSLRLGPLSVLVERPDERPLPSPDSTTVHGALGGVRTPLAEGWSDAAPAPRPPHRDGSLLEAFCEGAGLDASALSGVEPHELMQRIGAVYQQTVLGLSALMADRARVKEAAQLERTTIQAAQNNPFKWTPTRRLAQDLLCDGASEFLSGADAVRASFDDLGRHMTGLSKGVDSMAQLVVDSLSPAAIEAEAKRQSSLLKGAQALRWDIHNQRHRDLVEGGALTRAFAQGYVEGGG